MCAMVMTTPVSSVVAAAVATLSLVVALTVLGEPLAALAQPTGKVLPNRRTFGRFGRRSSP
jgi:hypothetical protein